MTTLLARRLRPSNLLTPPSSIPTLRRRMPPTALGISTLSQWTTHMTSQPSTTQTDLSDLNRGRALLLCLPSPNSTVEVGLPVAKASTESVSSLTAGSSMPLGSELVLFHPLVSETDVGADGADRTWSPPGGLDQRMWAGGAFEFHPTNRLTVGQRIERSERVEKVEIKQGKKTGEMALVWRKLVYSNDSGVVTTERRCHVYRRPRPEEERRYVDPQVETDVSPVSATSTAPERPSDFGWDYYASRTTLFRYSAATFNAHRIHLDSQYCRDQEGLPDCLVHGPLTATLLMNLVASAAAAEAASARLVSFEYRATAPLVVEQTVRLRGKWHKQPREGEARQAELWALDQTGRVCMEAKATVESPSSP
ncbi:hypothetical protein ACQY0O_003940 [Thecaphora frezii]